MYFYKDLLYIIVYIYYMYILIYNIIYNCIAFLLNFHKLIYDDNNINKYHKILNNNI